MLAAPAPSAVIYGCDGLALTAWEKEFFARVRPLGFILFARNCADPGQIQALTRDLRAAVGRTDAPVLIDQEGGRVARLKPPHWRAAPPAARFGELARHDPAAAARAVWLNARLLAAELRPLGITVNCAPVLDLRLPETHEAIGDRAFGPDPALVSRLGRACCEGLVAGGVLPVIKHIPGHGRARVDSHLALPVVEAGADLLAESDFAPFRDLNQVPWAMTGHLVFAAIDPDRPVTLSKRMIAEIIRGEIGFQGLLVGDDLSMQALQGDLGDRAGQALEAGCDLALHCNGQREEMEVVAGAVGPLSSEAQARFAAAERTLGEAEEIDAKAALAELDALLHRA